MTETKYFLKVTMCDKFWIKNKGDKETKNSWSDQVVLNDWINRQMINIIAIKHQSIIYQLICLTIQLLCLHEKYGHVFPK